MAEVQTRATPEISARQLGFNFELISLDAFQSLSNPVVDDEDASHLVSTEQLPPANIVVVSSTPGPDGIVADPVGIEFASEYQIDLPRRLRRAKATGEPGEVVAVELEDDTTEALIVLGVGSNTVEDASKAGAALALRLKPGNSVLCGVTSAMSPEALRSFCTAILLATYSFSRKSDRKQDDVPTMRLAVASVAKSTPMLNQSRVTSRAALYARELSSMPSNEKDPAFLAEQARTVAASSGLRCKVMDETALKRGKFGGLLAVGSGSVNPPRLVTLSYAGQANAPHVVLVGKGITYDSGGLSIKPADGMMTMKTDMSGAAVVLGVMSALRSSQIKVKVTGVLACAENMPSGSAYRPGDVVRHYGGRTSEILNTDAEGRLVLADALAYSSHRLQPDIIIDVATLTGAATLGLSRHVGALFSNDDGLASSIENAGQAGNERFWRLPLVDEYRDSLNSEIADISHVSNGSVHGGAITAALFLREFVGDHRWAHLDIAGPARSDSKHDEYQRGATGFGVRTLLHWLENPTRLTK